MPENRKHLRLPVSSTTFVELESPSLKKYCRGNIAQCKALNVSRGGLLVILEQEVLLGAILQIGIDLSDSQDTFYLTAEVRWCTPAKESRMHQNGWYAGFQVFNSEGSDIDRWISLIKGME